jgi:serine/threonine-protein kinase LegK1
MSSLPSSGIPEPNRIYIEYDQTNNCLKFTVCDVRGIPLSSRIKNFNCYLIHENKYVDFIETLNNLDLKRLQLFLVDILDVTSKKGYTYSADGLLSIKLTHTLIKRSCNPRGKYNNEDRYEIISNNDPLGRGAYGYAQKIKGTLVSSDLYKSVLLKRKDSNHKRIVKIECYNNNISLRHRNIIHEYSLCSPKLHAKMPVFALDKNNFDLSSYLIMRRIQGKTLYKILYDYSICLSTNMYLDLCLSLLESVKTELHDRNIIHRDLKPENIIADYNKNISKWQTTIIDYGLGKRSDLNDEQSITGNYLYMSPECYNEHGTNLKSDVYSIGCIISEVLGCDRKTIKSHAHLLYEYKYGINLKNIFTNTPDLNQDCRKELNKLILEMTNNNIHTRYTINEAIDKMKDIISFHNKFTQIEQTTVSPSKFSLFNQQIEQNNKKLLSTSKINLVK